MNSEQEMISVNNALLPIKRLYDPHTNKMKQIYVFPKDISDTEQNSKRLTIKIKMTGITYTQDFHQEALRPVVPGRSIIGKIEYCPSGLSELFKIRKGRKYLVYPYSTCQLENLHSNKDCNCEIMYGRDIDGGMQDCISVPFQLVIPIPNNVSLHDVCFIWDIIMPFYIQTMTMHESIKKSNRKIMIILNDKKKQINEILIVLNYFHIPQTSVVFMDNDSKKFNFREFEEQFDTIFCFDPELMNLAEFCCIPNSKSTIFTNFPVTSKSDDRSYHHMKLIHENKIHCLDVLTIISRLNESRETNQRSLPSPSTTDNSSMSEQSSHDGFYTRKYRNYSWIWYERDYHFVNFADLDEIHEDENDDDSRDSIHSIDDINRLISLRQLNRFCYLNRCSHNKKKKEVPFVTI